jgi:hypothetical protein
MVVFSDQKIVVSDNSGNVWLYDGTPEQPKSIALPSKLASGKKLLQKYQNNLYLLLADGTIFRVSNFDSTLDSATTLTKAGTIPFANIADWQIGGTSYALSADGKLIDFTKSKLGTVSVLSAPATAIYHLTGNDQEVDVTNGSLIWRYSPTGVQTNLFYLGSEKPIADLRLVAAGQYVFMVEKNLYQITLN